MVKRLLLIVALLSVLPARAQKKAVRPNAHVNRVETPTCLADISIVPDLEDNYRDAKLSIRARVQNGVGSFIRFRLEDADGVRTYESPTSGKMNTNNQQVDIRLKNVKLWTSETPYLYTLYVTLSDKNGKELEVNSRKIAFRKIDFKDNRLMVNGKPVLVKGVNLHEIDPAADSIISPERMMQNIRLMKRLNANAVCGFVCSGDSCWRDLCDRYGIYVVADANFGNRSLVAPDHTLSPNAHALQYAYQSIWTSGLDAHAGTVKVKNDNYFIDLYDVALEAIVEVEGEKVGTTVFADLDIQPQDEKTVTIPRLSQYVKKALSEYPDKEIVVNLNFYQTWDALDILDLDEPIARDRYVVKPV